MTFSHFETNRPDIRLAAELRTAGLSDFDITRYDRNIDDAQVRVCCTRVGKSNVHYVSNECWTQGEVNIIVNAATGCGLKVMPWFEQDGFTATFVPFQ